MLTVMSNDRDCVCIGDFDSKFFLGNFNFLSNDPTKIIKNHSTRELTALAFGQTYSNLIIETLWQRQCKLPQCFYS